MLYISRGAINNAVQFFEIESELPHKEIIEVFFEHLKYELPGGDEINRDKDKRKHFGREDDLYFLEISKGHAYIYVGESDGISYENNVTDAINFIYRKDPDNKPSLCPIM